MTKSQNGALHDETMTEGREQQQSTTILACSARVERARLAPLERQERKTEEKASHEAGGTRWKRRTHLPNVKKLDLCR